MLDNYNRRINYLRISVTDLCNLRCTYCMPEDGIEQIPHKDVLSFEEIFDVTSKAVEMGVTKVRLTGGEPLVRRGILDLVAMLAKIDGIEDLAMTTNAILLDKFAQPLKDAGLQRINISLDTVDPEKFRQITRCGDVQDVFKGIKAAQEVGFHPIKLNCVIKESPDEQNAREVAAYAQANDLEIRFIRQMDIQTGQFWTVLGGDGGNCKICNRLRLTSDGKIFSCLFNDKSYSIRDLGIKEALKMAVENKPESGHKSENNKFYSMGG